MALVDLGHKFDFAIFGAISYSHLLRGRTGAIVDNLCQRGYRVSYFELPPASVFQYFRNQMFRNYAIWDFLFPKPKVSKNLTVYSFPPIFPATRFNTEWITRYNQYRIFRLLRNQFLPLVKKNQRPIIALVSSPWWFKVVEKINFSLLGYDCIDDVRVFCNSVQINYFLDLQKKLIKKSDLIFISAKKLGDDILSLHPKAVIEFLPNGVDFDYFFNKGSSAAIPLRLKDLARPIVGFVGTLYRWIDTQILEMIAKTFNKLSIVLVGPVENIKIPKLSNIYLLPPIPYSAVPQYINAFDVCIIPFLDDPISERVDPIKVYEYLSLGKPVVATNLPELERIRELIYLAKNRHDFINFIKIALDEKNPEIRERRIAFARQNSWKIRVDQLIQSIENHLNKRSYSQWSSVIVK